ncbi:unnamed protein product [Plutella xylostella]|uniref:(diamondback moth) hypothetical protein n=1 Tax=Plutella xylostella TaxID=51655 RepID=A0A8S4G7A7_PLUXY|nr:unnamed protein product [Plutella xylostella]
MRRRSGELPRAGSRSTRSPSSVLYDGVVDDTTNTLAGVLAFLNETVSESAMDFAMRNRERIFRRKKKLQNFDPFTEEMYAQLSIIRADVMKLVSRYKDKDNHIT